MSSSTSKYWLLKAEPDSRVVKGKDVKFSVDDFQTIGTSPWEGVRNYEARNLMKEMKEGDKALFYHSNCKVPGIAAFAKVSKEAYPDYTAWDASHPYYDPKSNPDAPKWYMVDLTFSARAKHFVPLSLLRMIAETQPSAVPDEIAYIGGAGVQAIKNMDLVTRGRLSVQRVQEDAWRTIEQLADRGGWKEQESRPKKTAKRPRSGAGDAGPQDTAPAKKKKGTRKSKVAAPTEEVVEELDSEEEKKETIVEDADSAQPKSKAAKRKRNAEVLEGTEESLEPRRSTRARK